MRILVFGRVGQVGTELYRRAPEAVFLDRPGIDLTAPGTAAQAIADHAPDLVVNAAAYTTVDRAEDEEALALTLNATAPGEMAQACAARGIPFLHISTDYVFDGAGRDPWRPEDPPAPLSAYGRTKLEGERQVAAADGLFAILRTAWVFSAHGSNFVKTMLRLGAERDRLTIVDDQIGGPTPAAAIAEALLRMGPALAAGTGAPGIYHLAGQPAASWADFAAEIFAQAGLGCAVTPIPTAAYPTPATRPLNSRLDCSDITRIFGIDPPDWRAGLADVLEELSHA